MPDTDLDDLGAAWLAALERELPGAAELRACAQQIRAAGEAL